MRWVFLNKSFGLWIFWILPDIPWTLNVFTLFITEYYTEITSVTLPDFCLTPVGYQDYQSFPVYNCSNFQCILQCVKSAKKSAQASCSWFCSVLSMIVGVEVPRSNWPLLPWSLRFKRHSLPACSSACIWLGQFSAAVLACSIPVVHHGFLRFWGCLYEAVLFPWCSGLKGKRADVPGTLKESKACFVVIGDRGTGFKGTPASFLSYLLQEECGQAQSDEKNLMKDWPQGITHRVRNVRKQNEKAEDTSLQSLMFRGLKLLWSPGKDHFLATLLVMLKSGTEALAARVYSSVKMEVLWLENDVQGVLHIQVTANLLGWPE